MDAETSGNESAVIKFDATIAAIVEVSPVNGSPAIPPRRFENTAMMIWIPARRQKVLNHFPETRLPAPSHGVNCGFSFQCCCGEDQVEHGSEYQSTYYEQKRAGFNKCYRKHYSNCQTCIIRPVLISRVSEHLVHSPNSQSNRKVKNTPTNQVICERVTEILG